MTYQLAHFCSFLFRDSSSQGYSSYPTRLGYPNDALPSNSPFVEVLRDLSGLATACFTCRTLKQEVWWCEAWIVYQDHIEAGYLKACLSVSGGLSSAKQKTQNKRGRFAQECALQSAAGLVFGMTLFYNNAWLGAVHSAPMKEPLKNQLLLPGLFHCCHEIWRRTFLQTKLMRRITIGLT